MDKFEEKLLAEIADRHNISLKTLKDILKASNLFTYEKTTQGARINEYYGLIKYAASKSPK